MNLMILKHLKDYQLIITEELAQMKIKTKVLIMLKNPKEQRSTVATDCKPLNC
jgi:hypothetical protein